VRHGGEGRGFEPGGGENFPPPSKPAPGPPQPTTKGAAGLFPGGGG